jgi:hypothetical protein
MDNTDRHRIIAEAVRDAVNSKREADATSAREAARKRQSRSPATSWTVILVGVLVLAWIWIGKPEMVFGPGDPEPPTAEVSEASLRYALYIQQARVEEYATSNGRLPASLVDAGLVEESVSYERRGSTYTLVGVLPTLTIRFERGMDADSFLGSSLQLLRATE